jgi:cell division protease FtsH
MSLVKSGDKNRQLSTERRYPWETEETLVERRKKLRYRLMRFFSFWRILLAIALITVLFDASMMRSLLSIFDSIAQAFLQMFQFNLANLPAMLLQMLVFIIMAVGQFALLFWFLGRARMYTIWPGTTSEGISFKDYRGQPELLEQARQIVKLLRGVRVFEESGGEPLNGLLLEGPPGTGKTWMAQAISTEAGVPFFYIDASSMQSMFFGIAPLKVMNLYRKARNAAKDYGAAIIFIDEIDAVGARGGVTTKDEFGENNTLSRNRLPMFFGMGGQGILSTLLTEMDGFSMEHGWLAQKKTWYYKTILRRKPPKPEKRVLTIGATNRIGALDPALLRPGRFDKKVRVDPPDMEGRRDIFEYYLSKMAHDESIDPLVLAAETPNYTPADIKYLLNEALRYALFEGRTYIMYDDIRLAQPEHEMGMRTPIKNLTKEAKYRLAAHESGHAIAVRLYLPKWRISRITIIRQGAALGHVSYRPATQEYDDYTTYGFLMNRLRVAVAGKAGEMEFCGIHEQTLGVGGDFASIRAVLRMMADAGMFGAIGINQPEGKEVAQMMEETFLAVLSEVRMALRIHHEMGEALIRLLMEKNELLANEVEAFFDQYGFYTPRIDLLPHKQTAAAGVEN